MAVLNDAAEYFAALRESFLRAETQIQIVGWDIHSETPLVGPSGVVNDGLPLSLASFLKALLKLKPKLTINILIWDFAALYAAEREVSSAAKFADAADDRIRFCWDSCLPLGSAQHQKFVVVDNSLAFVGGLDLTIRRWDTSDHLPEHPFRKDPQGKRYPPFHDVQCMVDGEAATALGELAMRRWQAAGCNFEKVGSAGDDRWPKSVPIGAREVTVGIARTEVASHSSEDVHEVELLFERLIGAAKTFVYLENQFISVGKIAELLAQRMAAVPSLQVLIIVPKLHSSWLESRAMQSGRDSFLDPFKKAGVTERLRILHPSTAGQPIMVHSKLMIIDDDLVRIGSANLNNRSMGADSECDLVFEATTEAHRDFVRRLRRRLIGHFCGAAEEEVAENESRLLRFLDAYAVAGATKALQPIEVGQVSFRALNDFIQPIADPRIPLNLKRAANRMWTTRTILGTAGLVLMLMALALLWRYTPLRSYADIGFLSAIMSQQDSPFAALIAVACFVLGGLIIFPVVVLIAATAAALGPWTGAITAVAGVILSASLLFMIGRYLGHKRLQNLVGPRALRLQGRLVGKGIIAVAILRMVPLAPFSIVNVVAGASQLKLRDFLVGTIFGMMPGIAVMAALGSQIADFAKNESWANVIPLGLTIVIWIAICLAAQFVVTWLAGRKA
jgi:phosphatidylserine/phosphatidylglycerophosphate/cardiolipin synthase-like enzyme/uncharacterized membrane protein YdjX (TVP38/TMEM64 family)